MLDLHIHTLYSDGEFRETDIVDRMRCANCISVTDHNSVQMYISLLKKGILPAEIADRMIVGAEITIEGQPDHLVYYPEVGPSDLDSISRIESVLREIRNDEAQAVQLAYESLRLADSTVPYTSWDNDFVPQVVSDRYVLEARTRDLAAIRYRLRTGSEASGIFDHDDLVAARKARRSVSAQSRYSPFGIAAETGGEIVLAHPIKSAFIRAGRDKGSLSAILHELTDLLEDFSGKGGRTVEWEYIDRDGRHPLLSGHAAELEAAVLSMIERYRFSCVWGTDSHIRFPDDSTEWSERAAKRFGSRLPCWAKHWLSSCEKKDREK